MDVHDRWVINETSQDDMVHVGLFGYLYGMIYDFCLDGCMEWCDSVQDHVWFLLWIHLSILCIFDINAQIIDNNKIKSVFGQASSGSALRYSTRGVRAGGVPNRGFFRLPVHFDKRKKKKNDFYKQYHYSSRCRTAGEAGAAKSPANTCTKLSKTSRN